MNFLRNILFWFTEPWQNLESRPNPKISFQHLPIKFKRKYQPSNLISTNCQKTKKSLALPIKYFMGENSRCNKQFSKTYLIWKNYLFQHANGGPQDIDLTLPITSTYLRRMRALGLAAGLDQAYKHPNNTLQLEVCFWIIHHIKFHCIGLISRMLFAFKSWQKIFVLNYLIGIIPRHIHFINSWGFF